MTPTMIYPAMPTLGWKYFDITTGLILLTKPFFGVAAVRGRRVVVESDSATGPFRYAAFIPDAQIPDEILHDLRPDSEAPF